MTEGNRGAVVDVLSNKRSLKVSGFSCLYEVRDTVTGLVFVML